MTSGRRLLPSSSFTFSCTSYSMPGLRPLFSSMVASTCSPQSPCTFPLFLSASVRFLVSSANFCEWRIRLSMVVLNEVAFSRLRSVDLSKASFMFFSCSLKGERMLPSWFLLPCSKSDWRSSSIFFVVSSISFLRAASCSLARSSASFLISAAERCASAFISSRFCLASALASSSCFPASTICFSSISFSLPRTAIRECMTAHTNNEASMAEREQNKISIIIGVLRVDI